MFETSTDLVSYETKSDLKKSFKEKSIRNKKETDTERKIDIRIKKYIKKYVLPLVGWACVDNKNDIIKVEKLKSVTKDSHYEYVENDELFSYIYGNMKISIKIKKDNDRPNSKNLGIEKLFNHLIISFYNLDKNLMQNEYYNAEGKGVFNDEICDYAVQKGLCDYLISNFELASNSLEELISILEKWSTKTYEGHKVCFGFLFNVKNDGISKKTRINGATYGTFLQFLDDEYAAVLSDGISSVIELDCNCNLINYHSIIDENIIKSCDTSNSYTPMRFSQIINTYVTEEKLGVFLLQNGDIIIAKYHDNGARISFIKRNNKWLNFDYTIFKKRIQIETQGISSDSLMKAIYDTMLDVSLSHAGGIISVVDYRDKETSNYKSNLDEIINKIDFIDTSELEEIIKKKNNTEEVKLEDIYVELFFAEIERKIASSEIEISSKLKTTIENRDKTGFDKILEEEPNSEIQALKKDAMKKLTKKYYIGVLLKNSNNKFEDINRKLRSELIGLDGACILTKEGEMLAFGAIIQNDSGSSGGGRGAAAKKLSNYGGFAIKISTDGYIEVYHKENRIYAIK